MRLFGVLGVAATATAVIFCLPPASSFSQTEKKPAPSIVPAEKEVAAATTASSKISAPLETKRFRSALPGYKYSFPRDHGSHPEFQTEWWYFTGNLVSKEGRKFGYQATWFRTALVPELQDRESKWAVRDVIFAHLALTDVDNEKFYHDDRISRTSLDMAGADTADAKKSPRVWLDDWSVRFAGEKGERQAIRATGIFESSRFSLNLNLNASKPAVIQGINGVSQKSAGVGRASHYYSYTRLETTGTVRINGDEYSVTGESWFDHEFGSNQLASNQTGWDWFSLQLADGRELMLYQLRQQNGDIDPHSSGTLVEKDGRSRHLTNKEFQIEPLETWRSPESGGEYPARWKVTLPKEKLELQIEPSVADQEMTTPRTTRTNYWEGSVQVSGKQNGQPVAGQGYVELTGYAGSMQGTF